MAKPYLTAPLPTTHMPPGVPYIVANEAAERFSYYGMRGILVIFMTHHLLARDGSLAVMGKAEAMEHFHNFVSAVYFFPLLGAFLADVWLGKYRTILYLSIVYCLGHLALSLDETRLGLALGLGLVAIGSGGIKPCVSANVGDQFGQSNRHLLEKVFGWFYFSINAGSMFSTILIPELLDNYGPRVAFAVPGVLMFVATLFFWLGRRKYAHIPPTGWEALRELFSREGLTVLARMGALYLFVAIFWALYEQTGSAWVLQAEQMNLNLGFWTLKPAQTHTLNPILILIFMPLFTYVIYPAIDRIFPLTALRKISIGLFLTALAFAVSAMIENWITAGERPHFAWQALAYAIMTAAEVMVSITCLEFSYRQAPPKMKSLLMAEFLLSNSLGNQLVSQVNRYFQDADGKSTLQGADYYWLFCAIMTVTAVGFIFYAMFFRERTYIQQEQPA